MRLETTGLFYSQYYKLPQSVPFHADLRIGLKLSVTQACAILNFNYPPYAPKKLNRYDLSRWIIFPDSADSSYGLELHLLT